MEMDPRHRNQNCIYALFFYCTVRMHGLYVTIYLKPKLRILGTYAIGLWVSWGNAVIILDMHSK